MREHAITTDALHELKINFNHGGRFDDAADVDAPESGSGGDAGRHDDTDTRYGDADEAGTGYDDTDDVDAGYGDTGDVNAGYGDTDYDAGHDGGDGDDASDDDADPHSRWSDYELDDYGPREVRTRVRVVRDDEENVRRGRLTEETKKRLGESRQLTGPEDGDRWSTWGSADQGPAPHPAWLVTDLGAVDRELGLIKSGKEADISLLERATPDRSCLLAAKRYRDNDHRLFHRDAGYLEGRRERRSREARAMSRRSAFGRNLIAERWAVAEFAALGALWQRGVPVPYPVQRDGTEVLMEFIGDGAQAAPRLAQTRPEPDALVDLWRQLGSALTGMAAAGYAHGDLSPFNLVVHDDRLVVIDLPQLVDLVANPRGAEFLARDVRVVAEWFTARGLPAELADPVELTADLLREAGLA